MDSPAAITATTVQATALDLSTTRSIPRPSEVDLPAVTTTMVVIAVRIAYLVQIKADQCTTDTFALPLPPLHRNTLLPRHTCIQLHHPLLLFDFEPVPLVIIVIIRVVIAFEAEAEADFIAAMVIVVSFRLREQIMVVIFTAFASFIELIAPVAQVLIEAELRVMLLEYYLAFIKPYLVCYYLELVSRKACPHQNLFRNLSHCCLTPLGSLDFHYSRVRFTWRCFILGHLNAQWH